MSTIGSSLSKGADGTALINPAVLAQVAGLPKDLSRSAFDAAVVQERTNITNNGTGIWSNGEKISIFGEVGTRIWFVGASASLSHVRNVSYQGKTYALAADANVFGVTSGAPASGIGANGDYLVDSAAGLLYGPKASGAWPSGVALGGSGSYTLPVATASQLGGVKQGSGVTIAGDGTISAAGGTSITGITIDGSTIVASTASPYQMVAANRVVDVTKTTGAATAITLPTAPTLWVDYTIIDGKGDASTNNITVTAPGGGTITGWPGGAASLIVMNANNDAISFRAVNATTWRVV